MTVDDRPSGPRTSIWGAEDERGAANLLDEAAVRRGLASVRTGRAISLSHPMRHGAGPLAANRLPMSHYMTRDGGDYAAGLPEREQFGFADDVISLATHGTTHIDALAHVWSNSTMYNGFPSTDVTSKGARRCGVDKIGPIVTRALLVDAVPDGQRWVEPDAAITVDQLVGACDRLPVEIAAGDALLVRTGWVQWWEQQQVGWNVDACPGLHPDCAEWIAEKQFVLVGADNLSVEMSPSPYPGVAGPLHIALLRDQGIYLVELLNLAELAASSARVAMFVLNPLPIVGGVGSPVAPVVVI